MLVPRMYRPRGPADTVRLLRANPLAVVVGGADGDLYATHAPVVLEHPDRVEERSGDLVGASFVGHMNRANEHYAFLGAGGAALLVFQGPQAYVSPSFHGASPAAPTWNFITVHVRGRVEVIDRGKPTVDVVTATVRELERAAGTGWDMTGSLPYFDRIVPAVGAFRLRVESVQAMFKLGQEQPAEIRQAICDWLDEHPRCMHRRLSDAMREANEGDIRAYR